jgi:hypothetical protein
LAVLPTIADTFRVVWKWTCSGSIAVNVVHFRKTSSTSAALYTSIDAAITQAMWACIVPSARLSQMLITPLDGHTATSAFTTVGTKYDGGSTGEMVPAAAGLVSLRTADRGPRARGRIYLPFQSETNMANGLLTGASLTTAASAWNTFFTAMAAGSSPMCVASYKWSTAPTVFSLQYETPLATQRRRQSRLR